MDFEAKAKEVLAPFCKFCLPVGAKERIIAALDSVGTEKFNEGYDVGFRQGGARSEVFDRRNFGSDCKECDRDLSASECGHGFCLGCAAKSCKTCHKNK